jgi:hypothetical protein
MLEIDRGLSEDRLKQQENHLLRREGEVNYVTFTCIYILIYIYIYIFHSSIRHMYVYHKICRIFSINSLKSNQKEKKKEEIKR